MASKHPYPGLKNLLIIILVLMTGFTGYVIIANRNSRNMTVRQKLLKAVYPVMIWFTKTTRTNTSSLSNSKISPPVSLYNFSALKNDGQLINLKDLEGKKILIVNTASDCGYTGQYEELEKLYREHKEKLVILGFPANDFKDQEKGSDETIASFCKLNFGVTFPLIKKSKVIKGAGQNEIFQWLTSRDKNGWNDRAPTWNFCKYLIDEKGVLTHFFSPSVVPSSEEILKAIEE